MRRIITFSVFAAMLLVHSSLWADTLYDGITAEKTGQLDDALRYYTKALQSTREGSTDEDSILEQIARLVPRMSLLPQLPDDTITYEGRAEAAVEIAKTPEDYLAAANEYRKALRIAPWVSSYYFNLAMVLEKAGNIKAAIRDYELYILIAPDAGDLREVKKKIAGLRYQQNRQDAAAEENRRKEAADRSLAASLEGTWCNQPGTHNINLQGCVFRNPVRGYLIRIEVNGLQIKAKVIGTPYLSTSTCRSYYAKANVPYFTATVKNGRIKGRRNSVAYGGGTSIVDSWDFESDIRFSPGGDSFKETLTIAKDKTDYGWNTTWIRY